MATDPLPLEPPTEEQKVEVPPEPVSPATTAEPEQVIPQEPAPVAAPEPPPPDLEPQRPQFSGKDEDYPAWVRADIAWKVALQDWQARQKRG